MNDAKQTLASAVHEAADLLPMVRYLLDLLRK